MVAKIVIVSFFALVVGCLAVPTPVHNDQVTDHSTRIVGGTEAFAGSHPHMVALTTGLVLKSYLCGGSLISTRTIVTAAHCINAVFSFGSLSSSLRATVGTNRWNTGGQIYTLARNVTHQHYVASTIRNDIGLLITSNNVATSPLVSPIPVTFDHINAGVAAKVAGWGRISASGPFSASLLELTVATIDGQQCVAWSAQAAIEFNIVAPTVEPHIEICTYNAPAFGTCRGDSGSSLARISDGSLIGVVSWGFPCARGAPDVFVRVSAFRDWLQQHVV